MSFWRIISPFGWNSPFLQMHYLLLGIDMLCYLCWCYSGFFGWCMINGPDSILTFWMVPPPTNWSSFSEYQHNSISDELSCDCVRLLKLHYWWCLHCCGHTSHLQTKAHIALFVRPKQESSRSTWDKVIQGFDAFWLYASMFPSVHSCINKPSGAPDSMTYCSLTDN
jgi:hypothetical protein